jgi:predicted transcriptional regulator
MLEAIKEVSQHGTYYHFQFDGKDIKQKIHNKSLGDLVQKHNVDIAWEIADLLTDSAGVKITGNDVIEAIRKADSE